MLSWSEKNPLFPLCLYEPFQSLLLLSASSVLLPQWQHLGVRYLPLDSILAHFLDISRTEKKLIFTKATTVLQQFRFLLRNAPLFYSHLGTCSRLAGKSTIYVPWNQKKHIPSVVFFLFLFPEQSPACLEASGT